MAFPVIAASTNGGSGTSTASFSINLPAGVTADELLVIVLQRQGNWNATFPGDWNPLTSDTAPTGSTSQGIYWKIADGTETTVAVTWTPNAAYTYVSMRITGHHDTAPIEALIATGSDINPNPPSFNPTGWDVEDTLWLAEMCWDGTVNRSLDPGGYTFVNENDIGGTNPGGTSVFFKNSASASDDPGVFTLTGTEQWTAATIAIRPAAVAIAATPPNVKLAMVV